MWLTFLTSDYLIKTCSAHCCFNEKHSSSAFEHSMLCTLEKAVACSLTVQTINFLYKQATRFTRWYKHLFQAVIFSLRLFIMFDIGVSDVMFVFMVLLVHMNGIW